MPLRLVVLGALDLDQGGEELADLVGQLGAAVDVLLQAGPLAAAVPLQERLGQLADKVLRRPPWPRRRPRAIGASGATAEQDEQCAQAGAASL